jgi:hypothetical protein
MWKYYKIYKYTNNNISKIYFQFENATTNNSIEWQLTF